MAARLAAPRHLPYPGDPILILTADGRASQKAAEIGAEGCIGKPFEIAGLLGEVARLAAS